MCFLIFLYLFGFRDNVYNCLKSGWFLKINDSSTGALWGGSSPVTLPICSESLSAAESNFDSLETGAKGVIGLVYDDY